MKFPRLGKVLPSWKNILLAVFAAVLLILAFPDFEFWFFAWFALVPLMWAVEREKASTAKSFVLGWIFGTIFFFGTCWWLTYAPINYAGFPPVIAYFLLFCVTAVAGLFPAIFAGILSIFLRRFGSNGFLAAPFVWVFTEFLRYWVTGNNWNAIGYSQFSGSLAEWASIGGVLSVSFAVVIYHLFSYGLILLVVDIAKALIRRASGRVEPQKERSEEEPTMFKPLNDGSDDDLNPFVIGGLLAVSVLYMWLTTPTYHPKDGQGADVVAIQSNVPMSGLDQKKWQELRDRQVEAAEIGLRKIEDKRRGYGIAVPAGQPRPTLVILPESPMNFLYSDDREFQQFIGDFARRNNVSVLFNSAEPDKGTTKYFNSAVMVGPDGKQVDQYDKIYLLPFGEAVPSFLEGIVPGFVGNFAYGREYDLFPVGDAKAGVMICFESHFGALSREYVKNGADVIIEMTNDGYLGPTSVLRQHLANAVFRAVETNRPVLRVTNVGITAYVNEKGNVLDATQPYQEDTRVWSVSKSDGSQTFYVKYGDWFAWLCSMISIGILLLTLLIKRPKLLKI